jgi:hypothetical protein
MKKVLIMCVAMLVIVAATCQASEKTTQVVTKTGDRNLDRSLIALNEKARGNMDYFISTLSIHYDVSQPKIQYLLDRANMLPSDVYMAVKIASVTKKPVDTVVETYDKNKGKGWGVIAKRLGIKPGSKEFHALKQDSSGLLEKQKGKGKTKAKKNRGD